ncbi:hypothetical protein Daus18300_000610 [Diaporthe australafricana]|uniref:Rhodopsin domain-containing protein n=1 Tax=Diaporthe australafricana TaxID=127596 RepID=A0ABR3Y589_9PEZI
MADTPLTPEDINGYIGHKLMGAGVSMLIIITIVYIFFNISRIFCAEKNHWEVWTIYPLAYLASAGLCISDIVMVKIAGGGHHIIYLFHTNPNAIVNWLKIQTGDEIIYMTSVTLPRVAICILYLRIFTQRWVRIFTWITLTVCMLHWFGSGILAEFLICHPYAYKWDKTIENGHCGDTIAGFKYVSVPNLVIDVALIALPISSLYRLHVSRLRKIGIFITFMTGCLGIVGSLIRFVEFFTIDFASDLTYLGVWTMIFTTMEPCSYFVCSCLPGTRPLARQIYHKTGLRDAVMSRYKKSKGSSNNMYDLSPVGKHYGVHSATITSSRKGAAHGSQDNDTSGLIRLQETFQVETASRRTSPDGWRDGNAV